jgi:DNA-binding cell septation regulator SpoVG
MKVIEFKPSRGEGSILGEVCVYFPGLKMKLYYNIIRNKTNGSLFASMPSKQYKVGEEVKYFQLVKFDKEISEQVNKEIVKQYELFINENSQANKQEELPF